MKLRRKLVLSAAALAACAVTLTSTTYAWYVSNSEATVSGIGGSTTAGASGTDVLVAEVVNGADGNKTAGNFTNSITLSTIKNVTLSPVSKFTNATDMPLKQGTTGVTEGGFVKIVNPADDATTRELQYEAAGENAYIEYSFYVLSTGTKVSINATFTNTTGITESQKTAVLPTQVAYGATGITGVATGHTFAKDAIDALKVEVFYDDAETGTTYDANKMFGNYESKGSEGGDANQYYQTVMKIGTKPVEVAAVNTVLNEISVTANTPKKITMRIWLEGGDSDCFNSCAGQTFDLALKFSAPKTVING